MDKWQTFKLRVSLLRIWFVKNLSVFLELGIFITVILIFTGQVDENTPVLSIIFGDLSIAIREILTTQYSGDTLVNSITVILSLLVTVGTLNAHTKKIALQDIKSTDLKRSLVRAGLYFNGEGVLVKRIDGEEPDATIEPTIGKESLFQGVTRSVQEFNTIMNARVDEGETYEEAYDEAEEAAGLEEAGDSYEENKDVIRNIALNALFDENDAPVNTDLEGNAVEPSSSAIAKYAGKAVKWTMAGIVFAGTGMVAVFGGISRFIKGSAKGAFYLATGGINLQARAKKIRLNELVQARAEGSMDESKIVDRVKLAKNRRTLFVDDGELIEVESTTAPTPTVKPQPAKANLAKQPVQQKTTPAPKPQEQPKSEPAPVPTGEAQSVSQETPKPTPAPKTNAKVDPLADLKRKYNRK